MGRDTARPRRLRRRAPYLEDGAGEVDLTIRLTKLRLLALIGGDSDSDGVETDGDTGVLQQLFSVIDPGDEASAIVTP